MRLETSAGASGGPVEAIARRSVVPATQELGFYGLGLYRGGTQVFRV